MYITVITTTYNSEKIISKFIDTFSNILKKQLKINNYEIIIVDDGSTDKTINILKQKKQKNKKLKVIELNQNYGQHAAIKIALENVKKKGSNDFIFYCDSDLEEDPKILIDFYQKIKAGYQLVFGYQKKRVDNFLYSIFSNFFYILYNILCKTNIPNNVCSSHLFSSSLLKKILKFKEKNFWFHGIIHSINTKKIGVCIKKKNKGISSYNLKRHIKIFFEVLFYNTTFPLHFIFWTGVFLLIISMALILLILINIFIFNYEFSLGWPSIIILIFFIGGITQMFIGVIGLYISYIFDEIKKRPVLINNMTNK